METAELFPRDPAYQFTLKLIEPFGWTLVALTLNPHRRYEERDRETYEALSMSEALSIIDGIVSTE